MPRLLLQLAFAVAFAGWFVLLVWPAFRDANAALAEVNPSLPFWVAKGLHAGVYAALSLGAVLLFRRPAMWWALGAVGLHAPLGELGQYLGNEWFATGREGSVRDVLIDWAGAAAGVGVGAFAGWVRRQPPSRRPAGEP